MSVNTETVVWRGLSSDTKPTQDPSGSGPPTVGSRFICVDTGATYDWNGSTWTLAVATLTGDTSGGGGGAITVANGANVVEGSTTDAPVDVVEDTTARTFDSLLKGIKNYLRLMKGMVLAAGTAIIGKVGIDQTIPGTTNATQMKSQAANTADVNAPASNTAAVVTYATAGVGVSNVIGGVAWSYNAAPTAGRLKVEDGSSNVVFDIDITAAGPGVIVFARPKKGTTNTALIVTLAAGGSGVTGKVSVTSSWTE